MSDDRHTAHSSRLDTDTVWTLLLALTERRRADFRPTAPLGFAAAPGGGLLTTAADDPAARLIGGNGGLSAAPNQDAAARDLVALYAPLFAADPSSSLVVAHLGQSIDAMIATRSGDACFVTGPENIVHLHRMRALCDAVIVGAGTAATDDPRLTTRLVDGPNPVRVVIDPERRLSGGLRLFGDGEAPTLVACADDRLSADDDHPTLIGLPRDTGGLALADLIGALRDQGLRRLFVEGGGITVSRWMNAGLLDRLQVTIAPVFIGDGRPALALPPAARMASCLRPPTRVFRLGEDLLWDFELRRDRPPGPAEGGPPQGPSRVC